MFGGCVRGIRLRFGQVFILPGNHPCLALLQDFADLAADVGAVIFGKFVDGGVAVGFVGNVGNALRIAADLFGGQVGHDVFLLGKRNSR